MTDKFAIILALFLAALIATAFDLPDWTICAGAVFFFGVIVVVAAGRR